MTSTGVSDALDALTTDELSYVELVDLYNELRTTVTRTAETTVSERALAQVLQEFIDYLDFVEAELEKSVGITRDAERERLLASLDQPRGATPMERVYHIIQQWDSLERYSAEEIAVSVGE